MMNLESLNELMESETNLIKEIEDIDSAPFVVDHKDGVINALFDSSKE